MKNLPIPRLDKNPYLRNCLLKYSRIKEGEIWDDPLGKHRIGCLDAASQSDIEKLMARKKAVLAIHDPPYNLIAFEERKLYDFVQWCKKWIATTDFALVPNSSLYVWLGADQRNGFQPLPDFMVMMRHTDFQTRSFITMRNQRGYGTPNNWMAVRQELLYYIKGNPTFNVDAKYTDIPKILRGYYKEVNGQLTENLERSKSENIRAGNVWVDIQQVFYRMKENVNGCYAQKPIKSAERIIRASSNEQDLVIDFFCHSASTLISAEMNKRRCYTIDSDPIYCEMAIRRLERFRQTGKTGWQNGNPFEREILTDPELISLVGEIPSVVEDNQLSLI
ncbi:site-specific DNA-methyltransferase [candidate division TA06 bacterium]|uniref:Methyltransferase n=1 Tax=candidate division TA06 bacterium TaxID=2250710 RepID=A0A933I9Z9_UNCT6|nr:site-specific DNA-methyltransferase [candidate division TA06 bacterium]